MRKVTSTSRRGITSQSIAVGEVVKDSATIERLNELYSEAVKVVMCWDAARTAPESTRARSQRLLEEMIERLRAAVEAVHRSR